MFWAGLLVASSVHASVAGSCIISGTLERYAADSDVSSPVTAFDSVAVAGGFSDVVAVFDSVSFAIETSAGKNLNTESPALVIILR